MASAADSAQNVEFRFNCLIGAIYTDFTVLNNLHSSTFTYWCRLYTSV